GAAFVGLPQGGLGAFGALTRTEQLVLTEAKVTEAYGVLPPSYLEPTGIPAWSADYPLDFRAALPTRAGYSFHPGGAAATDVRGYFASVTRRRYDFQSGPTGCGLVLETLDPLHDPARSLTSHRTLIAYDPYQLFAQRVTDAAGLLTQADYDYRTMQAR